MHRSHITALPSKYNGVTEKSLLGQLDPAKASILQFTCITDRTKTGRSESVNQSKLPDYSLCLTALYCSGVEKYSTVDGME